MIVIVHQNIGVDQNSITIMIISQDTQEFSPIPLIKKYLPSFVPSTRNVVQRSQIFYSYRPSHSTHHITVKILCVGSRNGELP
jgi:hypothetical protein